MEDKYLRSNSDSLFEKISEIHPEIKIGEDSSQVRNIVRKAEYDRGECFLKIGRKENLENLIAFMNNSPETKNFGITEFILSGDINHDGQVFTYYLERGINGISLRNSHKFVDFNKKVVDIVIEIDSFPDLVLPRTTHHLKSLNDPELLDKYKGGMISRLEDWYKNSDIKFPKIFDGAIGLLEDLSKSESLEVGTIHGEFNFHHILSDDAGKYWIIDWERVSQANIRFLDLAEYIGRSIVNVDGGIEYSKCLLEDFIGRNISFSKETLLFGIYHRIIGGLWESSNFNDFPSLINVEDEEGIVQMLNSLLVD